MRIYAVLDASKQETRISEPTVFVVYLKANWKREELLNVFIVDVVAALANHFCLYTYLKKTFFIVRKS